MRAQACPVLGALVPTEGLGHPHTHVVGWRFLDGAIVELLEVDVEFDNALPAGGSKAGWDMAHPLSQDGCTHVPHGKGTPGRPAHLHSKSLPEVGRFKPDLELLPLPLAVDLRAIKDIWAQHLTLGSLLHPHTCHFPKGPSGPMVPRVPLQPLSGPRVAQPISRTPKKCGSLKPGDQGTCGREGGRGMAPHYPGGPWQAWAISFLQAFPKLPR